MKTLVIDSQRARLHCVPGWKLGTTALKNRRLTLHIDSSMGQGARRPGAAAAFCSHLYMCKAALDWLKRPVECLAICQFSPLWWVGGPGRGDGPGGRIGNGGFGGWLGIAGRGCGHGRFRVQKML